MTNSLIKPRVWKNEFCLKKSDMALFVTVRSWDRLARVLRFYLNFRVTSRYLMRLLQIGDWSQQSMEPVHLPIYSSLHLPAGHALTKKKKRREKNKIFQSLSWCHMQIVIQELRLRIYKLEWRTFDPCHMQWPNPLLYYWLFFFFFFDTFEQQNLQRLVLATQKKPILGNSNLREWNGLKTAIWCARATSSFFKIWTLRAFFLPGYSNHVG